MAPVERTAEEAVDRADMILRAIKPPPVAQAVPVRRLESAITQAESAMTAAKAVAVDLRRMLGEPRAARPAEQRAQLEKTQERLAELRSRLENASRQETGIESIDRRRRPLTENTAKGLDSVTDALNRGDVAAAGRALSLIEPRIEAIEKVTTAQSMLIRSNVHQTVLELSDAALNHFISGQTVRADLLLKTCERFARYRTVMETTPPGEQSRTLLLRTAAVLAGSQERFTDAQLGSIGSRVDEFTAPLEEAQRQISYAIGHERAGLMASLRGGMPPALAQEAERLVGETRQLGPQEVAGLGPERLGMLSKRFLILKEAIARTGQATGMTRDLLAQSYAGALASVSAGDHATSDVFLFAAGELASPSAGSNIPAYRVLLGRHAGSLAKAATAEERDAAKGKLQNLIGSALSRQLSAGADYLGGDAGAALRSLADGLQKADQISLEKLGLAKFAAASFLRFRRALDSSRLSPEQKMEAISIFGRGIAGISAGRGDIAGAQFTLASGYLDPSSTQLQRDGCRNLSAALQSNPAAMGSVRSYLQLNGEASRFRGSLRRFSGDERRILETVVSELETLGARISSTGTIASPEDIQANERSIRARMSSDAEFRGMINQAAERAKGREETLDAAASRLISSAAREAAEQTASRKLESISGVGDAMLSLRCSRRERKGAVELLNYSLLSAQAGNLADSGNFRMAADTYLKLGSVRDKDALLGLCRDAYEMQQSGQPILAETALRKMAVYRQMAVHLPGIRGPERRNAQAYFDMALIAASRVGNPQEFRAVQELATTYAMLAKADVRGMDPELREQRDKAMAELKSEMGDYRWLGSRRLADIGAEGRAGWQPRRGQINTPLAFALTSGTGTISLSERMVGSEERGAMLASLTRNLGREPTEEEVVRDAASRGWKRLSDLEASCISHGALLERIDFGRLHRNISGLSERHRQRISSQYGAEAARLRGAAQRAAKQGSPALGEYYEMHSRYSDHKFVLDSADRAREMHARGVEQNLLAISLGREADGAETKSADEMTSRLRELRGMLAPEEQTGFDARLRQAGTDAAAIRTLYSGSLRLLAQRNAGQAMALIEGAKEMMGGLRRLDQSVRGIDTRVRESGRMELYASISIHRALSEGRRVDFLGNRVDGERPAPELEDALRQHAGRMLRVGTGMVRAQNAAMQTRNVLIARAKRARDENFRQAERQTQALAGIMTEEAIAWIARLGEGLDFRKPVPVNLPEDERARYLHRRHQAAVASVGGHEDMKSHDTSARHEDYKRAVRLARAERFGSAGRALNHTEWAMERDGQLFDNQFTIMSLQREHERHKITHTTHPDVYKATAFTIRMIGALPPEEAGAYFRRFTEAKTDKEIGSLYRELIVSRKLSASGTDISQAVYRGGVVYYNADLYRKLILERHEHRMNGDHELAGVAQASLELEQRTGVQQERAYLNLIGATDQRVALSRERDNLDRAHLQEPEHGENEKQREARVELNSASQRYFLNPMIMSIGRADAGWARVQQSALEDIKVQGEALDERELGSTPLFERTAESHSRESQSRMIATQIWSYTRPHLELLGYAKDHRRATKSYTAAERGGALGARAPMEYAWQAHGRWASLGVNLIASVLHQDNAPLGNEMLVRNRISLQIAPPGSFMGQRLGSSVNVDREIAVSDELKRLIGFGALETSSYGHGSVRTAAKNRLTELSRLTITATFRQMGVEPHSPDFQSGEPGRYKRFEADGKTQEALGKLLEQLHSDLSLARGVLAYGTAERGMFIKSWSKSETNRFLSAVGERFRFYREGLEAVSQGNHGEATRLASLAASPGYMAPVRKAMDDKKSWDRYLGYATIATEMITSTLAFAVAPVCPAALAVPTAFSIKHGTETGEMIYREGWSWRAGMELGMNVVGTVLPFMGEASILVRSGMLARGGQRARRLMQAEQAVERATAAGYKGAKLRAFIRASPQAQETMIRQAQKVAAEAAAGTMTRRQASAVLGRSTGFMQYLTGGPAITGFQKSVHYTGHAFMATAAVNFVAGTPEMMAAFRRGDIGLMDFVIGGWQSFVQPAIIAGYSMRASTRAYSGVQAPVSRWKQWTGAAFLGLPIQPRAASAAAVNHARLNRALERMPQAERGAYAGFIQRNGVSLDPASQVRIVEDYAVMRNRDPSLTFQSYYSRQGTPAVKELRTAMLESGFQRAYWEGIRPRGPELEAYVAARRNGVPAERAAELAAAQARAAVPPVEVSRTAAGEIVSPQAQQLTPVQREVGDRLGQLSQRSLEGDSKKYLSSIIEHLAHRFGGRDKIPPQLMPREGANLYDTVKNSAPALRELMASARQRLGFDDNIYAGFQRKHRESQAGRAIVESLQRSGKIAKDAQPIGVIAFDGAATWMKNGLGYGGEGRAAHDRVYHGFEVGDLGLLIYMEAARRYQQGNRDVYTRLQTAQGDEVIMIVRGDKLGRTPSEADSAIKRHMDGFRKMLTDVAREMGVRTDSPLFRSLSDVNAHGGVVGVGRGGREFSHGGKTHATLDGALVAIEVDHSLRNMVGRAGPPMDRLGAVAAAKKIREFISNVMESKTGTPPPPLTVDGQRATIQEGGRTVPVEVGAYATFRLDMVPGLRKHITRLAESNGKGKTHNENGMAGPSVMNQLGHPVTDRLTAHFHDSLRSTLRKAGILDKVDIYSDGPMTFAFRFKGEVDAAQFNKALADAAKRFPARLRARGVEGVTKATVASAAVEPGTIHPAVTEVSAGRERQRRLSPAELREAAEKKARDNMKERILEPLFSYQATARGASLRLGALISNAHLAPREVRAVLTDSQGRLLVDRSVLTALEKVPTKRWVRTPEDLISHFRDSGVHQTNIEGFFRLMGFERIVTRAKATAEGQKLGAPLRAFQPEAAETAARAAAAAGGAAAPRPRSREASRVAAGEIPAAARQRPRAAAPEERVVVAPELAAPREARRPAPEAEPSVAELKRYQEAYGRDETSRLSVNEANAVERRAIRDGFVRRAREDDLFRTALMDNMRKGMHADDAIADAAKKLHPDNPERARELESQWKGTLMHLVDPDFNPGFFRLTIQEKTAVLQKEFDGRAFDAGYKAMLKATSPKSGKLLIPYFDRFKRFSTTERNRRLSFMREAEPALFAAVGGRIPEINRIPDARTRRRELSRLKSEWNDLQRTRRRLLERQVASERRSPQELQSQERELVRRLGGDEAAARYDGTTEGRLSVLERLGIRTDHHKAEKARLAQKLKDAASDSHRDKIRQNLADLDRAADMFFGVVIRGNLQKNISALPGFKGASITRAAHLTGGEGGVFQLDLSNGKRIFLKLGSGSSAQLGSKLAVEGGMLSSRTHTDGLSYDIGLRDRRGRVIKDEYHLIEDIRNLKGTKADVVLPDGRRVTAEVSEIAMVMDVMDPPKRPEDPGPRASRADKNLYQAELRIYERRAAEFESNPVVKEFYRVFGTREGRERILQAWNSYHDLCRRISMGDRRPPNTAIAFMRVPGSKEPLITFQPIDTGAVGWQIGRNENGTINYQEFQADFGKMATAQFIRRASYASTFVQVQRAMGIAVQAEGAITVTTADLYRSFTSDTARQGYRLPAHDAATLKRMTGVARAHRPALFGMNLENSFGNFRERMGRKRLVTEADGQMRLFSKDVVDVLTDLNRPGQGENFHDALQGPVRSSLELPESVLMQDGTTAPPERGTPRPASKEKTYEAGTLEGGR